MAQSPVILRQVAVIADAHGNKSILNEMLMPPNKIARLTCSCHVYKISLIPWCKHIKDALTGEFDGGRRSIDDLDDLNITLLPSRVEVPIFWIPSLFIPVELVDNSPIPKARVVEIYSGEPIGFIFPGQGRYSLRKLIIDWLVERSLSLPTCSKDHHYQPLPWEEAHHFNHKDKWHLVNLADLLLTGACRTCNEDNGVPDV